MEINTNEYLELKELEAQRSISKDLVGEVLASLLERRLFKAFATLMALYKLLGANPNYGDYYPGIQEVEKFTKKLTKEELRIDP